MDTHSATYEQTYQKYLADLKGVDIPQACQALGLECQDGQALIQLVDRLYTVSPQGVTGPSGKQVDLGTCVVLCRYLLMCPTTPVKDGGWTTFRDIKGAGPLTVFWANEVERAVSQAYDGKAPELAKAGADLGGAKPEEAYSYDVEVLIPALTRIPALVLFNDSDEDFPAKCTLLFRESAGTYLDPESLAILGGGLAMSLVRRAKS